MASLGGAFGGLGWKLAGAALLLFLLAWATDSGRLATLALAALGLWAMVEGRRMVVSRQDASYSSGDEGGAHYETYVGAAAVLRGVAFVVLGLALASIGLAAGLGLGRELVALLRSRPGLPLLCAGVGLLAQGLSSMLGSLEQSRPSFEMAMSLFSRLGGLLLAVLGIALAVAGAWAMLFPGRFAGWLA
jgi:hypothetical protein